MEKELEFREIKVFFMSIRLLFPNININYYINWDFIKDIKEETDHFS